MKKKLFFGLIYIFCTFWLSFSADAKKFHGEISGDLIYQNRYFYYKVEKDKNQPKYWRITIFSVDNVKNKSASNSMLAYNSTISIKEKPSGEIEWVKIFGAKRQGYIWNAMLSDYFKATFDYSKNQINYENSGTLMQNPAKISEKEQIFKFDPKKTVEQIAVLAINSFIMSHNLLFDSSEKTQKTEPTKKIAGNIVSDSKKISYELSFDFYQKGDHEIKIRDANEAILFSSICRIEDKISSTKKLKIEIYHAVMKDFAWGIYESDFEEIIFDFEKGTVQTRKEGVVMPVGEQNKGKLSNFDPNSDLQTCVALAVKRFTEHYHEVLLKY
ncbi:MAG: hypothetical protein EAZ97_10965 [Bacteroidetes bacterium]|nr:MAG: hypothetical protein EAZ97_10965 [Bacteroidota bacterium]